jgi:hypothetical protein
LIYCPNSLDGDNAASIRGIHAIIASRLYDKMDFSTKTIMTQ